MDVVRDLASWTGLHLGLLLISLCSQCRLATALRSNLTYPPYIVIPLGESHGSNNAAAFSNKPNVLPMTSDQSHAHQLVQPVRPVTVHWLNSTTDSISFSWELSNKYTLQGYIRECVVEYLTTGGKFTTQPLQPSVNEYTFSNLDVDTTYTICAYMIEMYGVDNETILTHSKCVKIATLEYIRRDSVLIMLLILGYYLFMGTLGFTQWKRKCWAIERRNRAKGSDCNSIADKYSMRWKDLEQKEKLVTKAGCSIETNDT